MCLAFQQANELILERRMTEFLWITTLHPLKHHYIICRSVCVMHTNTCTFQPIKHNSCAHKHTSTQLHMYIPSQRSECDNQKWKHTDRARRFSRFITFPTMYITVLVCVCVVWLVVLLLFLDRNCGEVPPHTMKRSRKNTYSALSLIIPYLSGRLFALLPLDSFFSTFDDVIPLSESTN